MVHVPAAIIVWAGALGAVPAGASTVSAPARCVPPLAVSTDSTADPALTAEQLTTYIAVKQALGTYWQDPAHATLLPTAQATAHSPTVSLGTQQMPIVVFDYPALVKQDSTLAALFTQHHFAPAQFEPTKDVVFLSAHPQEDISPSRFYLTFYTHQYSSMRIRPTLLALGGCLMAGASAHTTMPSLLTAQSPTVTADTVFGPPNLVTSVPFQLDDADNMQILLPAEVGGRRGIFQLDTGAPIGSRLIRHYVKPNATGGLDTVLAGEPIPQDPDTVSFMVRLGTLQTPRPVSAIVQDDSGYAQNHRFQTSLGRIGLEALEPFETIIDYPHRRLLLIRLDSAGHRRAVVPAYTSVSTLPLVLVPQRRGRNWWGVQAHIGGLLDTLVLDTGTPVDFVLTPHTTSRVSAHVVNGQLDHLVLGNQTFDNLNFVEFPEGVPDILGSPFLSRYGVVGINQRTRQLILYK